MTFGMRKSERVNFERGIDVFMMGIDGTWRRSCVMFDVSQTGARLHVEDLIEGLDLKEFFLLLVVGRPRLSTMQARPGGRRPDWHRISGPWQDQQETIRQNDRHPKPSFTD